MLITSDHSDVYHYVGTPTNQHYTSLLSKSTMSYTISARSASGRYMPEITENERFWASLCAKNRKRPPKWAPKITENDPPWHISSKGIFGGPARTRLRLHCAIDLSRRYRPKIFHSIFPCRLHAESRRHPEQLAYTTSSSSSPASTLTRTTTSLLHLLTTLPLHGPLRSTTHYDRKTRAPWP